ncbi:MAG: hypothetical protein ACOX1V_01745 [Candidatus Iainarchaeum sp.]|nr:MAG: hypothetical protein BWY55_00467 [archaeon ADurb.Bin336]
MSYGEARKLTSRQLNANLLRALEQSRGKRVVNPRVFKNAILESSDSRVLKEVVNHFIKKGKSNVKIKLFLNRCASEKFNKNWVSRGEVLKYFGELAEKGDSFGLRGLMVGVKDSNPSNRGWALRGLSFLAAKGDARALNGLMIGVKDSVGSNRAWAMFGIGELSKKR